MAITSTRLTPLVCRAALVACAFLAASAAAATQVLYDANVLPNTSPSAQGWLGGSFLGISQTVTPGGTVLAPTGAGTGAFGGYSSHAATVSLFPAFQVGTGALVNGAFPVLDRVAGYSLDLGFQVTSERHVNDNRAGFSITLIGADLMGIEIGFQSRNLLGNGDVAQAGSIFAQGAGAHLFEAAENSTDPVVLGRLSTYNQWHLGVSGNTYTLAQGATSVLSGSLRNYSAYTGFAQDAYRTPNFVFFGDNTGSANATAGINYAAITTAVPEPASYGLLLVGLVLVGAAVRRGNSGHVRR